MKKYEAEILYKNYFQQIGRDGARKLLHYMEENGFFAAPASRGHHGAFQGGLAAHSVNVFRRLSWLAEHENTKNGGNIPEYSVETLAICALLHDLCKMDAYRRKYRGEADGKKWESGPYEATGNFTIGHGEKSVIIILRFMELTEEEMLAIRWHMGAYDFYARGGGYDLNNAFRQSKLAVMLHLADMMATHFDEREGSGNGIL